jgi:signal transduction histidine kinase
LAIFGAIYFHNSLSRSLDEELKVDASQIGHAIEFEQGKLAFRDWLRVVETEPARSVMSMQLFGTDGKLLEHYGPVGIPRLFDKQKEVTENGLTMRVLRSPLIRKGILVGWLQLQLPVNKREVATHEFLLTMTVMAPLVILAFGICSYIVAGIAVKPIEEMFATLKRFVADAGHELNTPSSVIQARAQSLDRKLNETGIATDDLKVISASAERMGAVVQDLMLLAELDSRPQQKTEVVDLSDLAAKTVNDYKNLAEEKNISLEFSTTANVRVVAEDESLIRILRNLLENAIKYSDAGDSVKVNCKLAGQEAVLIVEDTGIGIPQDCLQYIFERFYRVDKSRARDSGGSGLGLSIVKAIVEKLGGRVLVSSELGKGSKFSCFLPAKK